MKLRIGVSLDKEVGDALDEQVRSSPDLLPDRSEIVNAVLKAFFRSSLDHRARARGLIIMSRNGQLDMKAVHSVHNEGEKPIPMMAR